MVDLDAQNLDRTAQRLIVEARRSAGAPPVYEPSWQPVFASKVERIEVNLNTQPSVAVIWFPGLAWNAAHGFKFGDMIRIRTVQNIILFCGFVCRQDSGFFGGDEQQEPWERNALYLSDHRWLLAVTSSLCGQLARSRDNYTDYGQASQAAVADKYTYFTGRRCIFNRDGRPDRDPALLTVKNPAGTTLCQHGIFSDPDNAGFWTCRQILGYILSPLHNHAYDQLTINGAENLLGINHADWDQILNHIIVEGLNCLEAIQVLCQRLGWGFREDYDTAGSPTLHFFKYGAAAGYNRTIARTTGITDQTTILHRLHAPARGEIIETAVAEGKILCRGADIAEDIAPVVNTPIGLGGIYRFEFTAELVPAWADSQLAPDTQQSNLYLFLTEADLQYEETPDDYSYYKYYHPRGSQFQRTVGRRWALNETGRYTDTNSYDRGIPFDFKTIIPPQYIIDPDGSVNYGPWRRQLLPCLTVDSDDYNSVGIRVEFSFDGGNNWQVIPCAIESLPDEAGIYIAEANLAEMADKFEGTISGGVLDGIQLNYWSSLCDDKLNARSFKSGQWHTRLRITASIQLDQRLFYRPAPGDKSGSPFEQVAIHDYSGSYSLNKRTPSSIYAAAGEPVVETDATGVFNQQIEKLRAANQDLAISGSFVLDRMWLDDGAGRVVFALGDGIERLTGREYQLLASFAGSAIYPEIVRVIYYPEKQQQKLITRDLRFAEMTL